MDKSLFKIALNIKISLYYSYFWHNIECIFELLLKLE